MVDFAGKTNASSIETGRKAECVFSNTGGDDARKIGEFLYGCV